jgi:beta-lactamase regulating signal transducer with metallopeptidase domain
MNDLFVFAAHNTIVTLILASFVFAVTRLWRSPPAAHALWLLVLLKLVFPPLLHFDVSALPMPRPKHAVNRVTSDAPPSERPLADNRRHFLDRPAPRTVTPVLPARAQDIDLAANLRRFWEQGRTALFWSWLGGAALVGMVALTRIVRFERLLRDTLPASERLKRLAIEIAARLGIRRVPDVRYVECVEVPFLWCAGRRPVIVLPMRLRTRLDDERLALILAHELAHLRRRDHWVRAVEMLVSSIYWWNPLVWFIRRQIHQAEDLCCDAWVRWAFPDCTKHYAELLLNTAESLGASRTVARPLPATPFLSSFSLKARIEMILESRFAPYVSTKSLFVLALLAILVLPLFLQTTKTEARADSNEEAPAARDQEPVAATTSELPYEVKFEQGATRFMDGDKIAIVDVRGTAETFTPGNTYLIKGEYTLASHDRAELSAYITAMDAENGRSGSHKLQTTVVNRGDGTFTLLLPMSYRGWPHVSFYPADGGDGFGGNYFGTGDSVLKRWWGSKEKEEAQATPRDTILAKRFKYQAPFELGRTQTKDGGRIEIREVLGTRPQIEIGGQYLVRGRYVLPHGERGMLYFYATAGGAWGQTASLDLQSTPVDEHEGEFELIHGMAGPGNFHLILTDAERYSRWFADVYFGTGDNVYR